MTVFAILRAGYGAALLCVPGPLIRRVTGSPADRRIKVTARVLGARHLVQAAATARRSGPDALRIGASVDASHAASMFALAVGDRARRRAALVDGTVATTFSAVGMVLAGGRRRSANHPT